eukprot:89605-Rhodomonas_salina.2
MGTCTWTERAELSESWDETVNAANVSSSSETEVCSPCPRTSAVFRLAGRVGLLWLAVEASRRRSRVVTAVGEQDAP